MKKHGYITFLFLFGFVSSIALYGFRPEQKEVQWMSFDQAVKLCQSHPKKIFIDVYTKWCGWCKRMDATTYQDPDVIDYLNQNFYSVRLDAETTDTFHFKNTIFVNQHPGERGAVNTLASSLLDNKMMYPTTVYMDEEFNRLSIAPGYLSADEFKIVLRYFAENKYKTLSYEDYKKSLSSGGNDNNLTTSPPSPN